jgi:diphosphomevalonate decarboxylase
MKKSNKYQSQFQRVGWSVKKSDVVAAILGKHWQQAPKNSSGKAFAPTNIALCKYWGKRNQELNLPLTSSLSISLGNKGAFVELALQDISQDSVILNGEPIASDSSFYKKFVNYLDLFRPSDALRMRADIQSNIPIAAGLASSACGFASLALALNDLFGWQLCSSELSILARLGSGSASRSIEQGFVEWHAGARDDGMDSYGVTLPETWPELCVGLLIVSEREKMLSSREAMQRTIESSALYSAWPAKVSHDLIELKQAIATQDFALLGKTAESNATTMHATMFSAWPAIQYAVPETVLAMQAVWKLRSEGLALYFTQDAGPNIKLLFEKNNIETVRSCFPAVEILQPFLKTK